MPSLLQRLGVVFMAGFLLPAWGGQTVAAKAFVMRPARAEPEILRPTSFVVAPTPGASGATRFLVRLTGGTLDTVTIRLTRAGTRGTLTIGRAGRVILTEEGVGDAWAMLFGPRHLPVLVMQAAASGSGGYTYQAITWIRAAARFLPVAGSPVTAFRWDGAAKGFRAVAVPRPESLFGFGARSPVGFQLVSRLYDAWGHYAVQRYGYAPNDSAAGAFVSTGPVRYGPGAPMPHIAATFTTPAAVYQAFLDVRTLNLAAQARELAVAKSFQATWQTLHPLLALGPSLNGLSLIPQETGRGAVRAVTDVVAGQDGNSLHGALHAYRVTLDEEQVGARWLVTGARIRPIPLKVTSVAEVLDRILHDPAAARRLSQQGSYVMVNGAVAVSWQVAWAPEATPAESVSLARPWLTVDAVTGRVTVSS